MLLNIPISITPELIYALARMGHGDYLVIADSNFPSDSIANNCIVNIPIRVHGKTSAILHDILQLIPIDEYAQQPVCVMDRVQIDKELHVSAYDDINAVITQKRFNLNFVDRFDFYQQARGAFVIIQTDDVLPYANVIMYKGVITPI